FVARVFACLYRDEVAGVILIDSSHPEQQERMPRYHMTHYPGGTWLYLALERARPLGLQRALRDLGLRKAGGIPSARQRRADQAEMVAVKAMSRDTAALDGDLRHLPLAVLTKSPPDPNDLAGSRLERAQISTYPAWKSLQD